MHSKLSIETIEINGIPTLKVEREDLKDRPLPLVLFWHGWTSVKERNLYYAYLLATEGIRVILPEAKGHGERFQELPNKERQIAFFQVVATSIKESEDIRLYCQDKGWIDNNRVAMAGTSMGAIITLGAVASYDWIKSAVSLMGTPYMVGFARYKLSQIQQMGISLPFTEEDVTQMMNGLETIDLSKHPERIKDLPLLFWHGEKDQDVPYAQSRLFYDSYQHEDRVHMSYVGDPKAEHVVTQEGAIALRDWLVEYI